MPETRVQSLGPEDPLDKGMAAHSSILARRIPWMEEPGRLQSTGRQRVRHDRATEIHILSAQSQLVSALKSLSCSNTSGDSTYISLTRISSSFSVPNPLSHILCSGFNERISQFPEKPCAIITPPFLFGSLPTFSRSLKSDATASLSILKPPIKYSSRRNPFR